MNTCLFVVFAVWMQRVVVWNKSFLQNTIVHIAHLKTSAIQLTRKVSQFLLYTKIDRNIWGPNIKAECLHKHNSFESHKLNWVLCQQQNISSDVVRIQIGI